MTRRSVTLLRKSVRRKKRRGVGHSEWCTALEGVQGLNSRSVRAGGGRPTSVPTASPTNAPTTTTPTAPTTIPTDAPTEAPSAAPTSAAPTYTPTPARGYDDNKTQTLRPLPKRIVRGTCTTCGKPIYSDESRTRDEEGRRHHAKCLVIIRGKCFYCGQNVYNNEQRSTLTFDDKEHYYHQECGGEIRGSFTDASGRDGW